MSGELTSGNLFEYAGEVIIGDEAIDVNGHVNNAYYQKIYEQQRGLYVATHVVSVEEMIERFNLRPFMIDFGGRFRQQLFRDDLVIVHTAAEDKLSHIRFTQRMTRESIEASNFWCTIYMINEAGKPTRVPDEIREKINQINSNIH